jgi:iron(III) transport system substrate-binding protein
MKKIVSRFVLAVSVIAVFSGCGFRDDQTPSLTLYSGRSQDLIEPLIQQFTEQTGVRVAVRYGGTAELAATILEEGKNSPADVYLAQDAGSLGALAKAGVLEVLPEAIRERVYPQFQSPEGTWIGVSGRARVAVYHPERLNRDALPDDIGELTGPEWKGRVGWAPLNASFQSFVTALRVIEGEVWTRSWLMEMQANQPRAYARNTAIVQAVAAGEIDVGLSNHYYLHVMRRDGGVSAENHSLSRGGLMNVAGVGLLKTSQQPDLALDLIGFLLSDEAQRYFTETTFEYPLVRSAPVNPILPDLETLAFPDLDLNRLEDLEGTLHLLQELGIL